MGQLVMSKEEYDELQDMRLCLDQSDHQRETFDVYGWKRLGELEMKEKLAQDFGTIDHEAYQLFRMNNTNADGTWKEADSDMIKE